MMVVVGKCTGVREEPMRYRDGKPVLREDGSQAVNRTVSLLVDDGQGAEFSQYVTLAGRALADWAAPEGQYPLVAFDCSLRGFVRKSGAVGFEVKAWREVPAVVEALTAGAGAHSGKAA